MFSAEDRRKSRTDKKLKLLFDEAELRREHRCPSSLSQCKTAPSPVDIGRSGEGSELGEGSGSMCDEGRG